MSAQDTHFYTFTGNPLAETTMEFPSWETGKTQRAQSSSFQMGGKGINVCKMLIRLGARTTALSFLGGQPGEQCREWLGAHNIDYTSFSTVRPTRTGLVVRSAGIKETTFLGADSPPDAAAWQAAAQGLSGLMSPKEGGRPALAFCGSSPGWAEKAATPFHSAMEAWLDAKLPLFVDTYGAPLAWFASHAVDLVKINADELRGFMQKEGPVDELIENALRHFPVKAWIVSDGAGPVWYASQEERPRYQTPPVVREVSATGSGDVLMACLLRSRLAEAKTWDEAIRFGLPLASANAAHPGIAEF